MLLGVVSPVRSRCRAKESNLSLVPILAWVGLLFFFIRLVRPQFSHQFPSSECEEPGL